MIVAALLLTVGVAPAQLEPRPITGFDDLSGGDKLLHFGANVAIVDVAWAGAAAFDAPLWARVTVGVSAGVVASLGKEIYDLGYGDPSLADLAYDALGIGAGVGVALAVEAVMRRANGDKSEEDDGLDGADPPVGAAASARPSAR